MTATEPGRPTVVIIGGGYGGVNAAKALDEHARVVLVEPKNAFQHNVAALRAVVDAAWPERIFLPYDNLLAHGTVIRDRAVRVDAEGITLASGGELHPDFVILATGSTYPFPAKTDRTAAADSIARYHAIRATLAQDRVMLLGAGAVGLEFAGEIATVWPDKHIVLVDLSDEILPGPFDPRLRKELNRRLDDLGIERVLGHALTNLPDSEPGELAPFTTATTAGTRIDADIWFRCYGTTPVTEYLAGDLADARRPDGRIEVTPELQVVGADTIYAIGDITTIDIDRAGAAGRQAGVAATNIAARIAGHDERVTYTPSPPAIVLPIGSDGGAGQLPNRDEILDGAAVAEIKGRDLMVDRYVQLLNPRLPDQS